MNMSFGEAIFISREVAKNILNLFPFFRYLREKVSKRRKRLISNVDAPFGVFARHFNRLPSQISLDDKVVLEIGPGNSVAIALLLLAFGARKVVLVDKFKHLYWDNNNIKYHKRIVDLIRLRRLPFADNAASAILIEKNRVFFNHKKIEYHFCDAANLPFNDDSFDIVMSNAVLEHVHGIEDAIKELYRITKRGGIGIHEIDLGDHFCRKKALNLLRYPRWLWILMAFNRPGYSNRLRFADLVGLFRRSGFDVVKSEALNCYSGDIEISEIDKKFRGKSTDELRILTFWILLRK